MDLIDRVRELADEAAGAGRHELAQALHAVANLNGRRPAAVVLTRADGEAVVLVGPDPAALLADLKVDNPAEYDAWAAAGGGVVRVVRELRYVE